MCFNGSKKKLVDDCVKYINGKNGAFLFKKSMFDEFLTRLYEILQINSNDYSIKLKTNLRSIFSSQFVSSLISVKKCMFIKE